MPGFLTHFQILRPQYELSHADGVSWMTSAHTLAHVGERAVILEKMNKFGCKKEQIEKRGHELPDFTHENWEEMQLFGKTLPEGAFLQRRLAFHMEMTDEIFAKYYPEESEAPDHLIHVSCTGYASPSSAQKVVSLRGWGEKTEITHAYHMGCYASIPAIRMAQGIVQQKERVDIVHTELCSLHFNPASVAPDQIVLQSLFADGYIKYSLQANTTEPSLQVVALYEQLIPESINEMTWTMTEFGFRGSLSKKIPLLIAKHVGSFITTLAKKAGMNKEELLSRALFAVHPGGPKILDLIQETLNLETDQLSCSRKILKMYGNISSATLPHIWESLLNDKLIANGTAIVSLAFGPGLNIAGAILIKRGAT